MVGSVTEEGEGLQRGGKTGCGGINLGGGAQYPEVGQSSLGGQE